ncbi:MAG: serine hydrolase [Flavobacteriaceae bacterium]|nr:MAG: serine hydrolase [Flavobacteriaceae bacterium]
MKKIVFLLWLMNHSFLIAQHVDPLYTNDYKARNRWVDSIMNEMTIEEKIGQLFMVQAYSNKDEEHENFIKEMITKYHVGNLIFMKGTPEKQAVLNNKYQALSKVPLLIGFDGEWGLDMRLKNTYRFPWNMTLGAIQDNKLVRQLGERIGKHCKRLGIHVNFAPVADVNINSENPIIGNRSFGENKLNVTAKAVAFTRGVQSQGVLANAKHFPGHGDTATDSHHALPVLNFSKDRLDSIELYPYPRLFDAGVASVMTAHLSVPALEPDKNLPTSLSGYVVTDLLQKKLGFLGLVFTDGLNMKGATNFASSAEIDVEALKAGNDILLIPQDVPGSIKLIKAALKSGALTPGRIDISVRKILKAKYWAGLHKYRPVVLENLHDDLNSIDDELLHRKLVEASLTIIKNKSNIVPFRQLENKRIAYVKLGDDTGDDFVRMLQNYTEITIVSDTNLKALLKKLKPYNLVIIGFHTSNEHPWKPYKFNDKEMVWLQKIAKENEVVLDIFASPYSLLKIKSFANIEAVVVSYQNSKLAQEISAQALFGAVRFRGKLPVSIKKEFKENTGLTTLNLNRLRYTIPEAVQLSSGKLAMIDSVANKILTEKMTPGLQILVARKRNVVYQKSFGYHTNAKKKAVKNSDIYDVASLTKILASLPMVMKAEEDKKIKLSSSVKDILPTFKKTNKDTVTVKELLSHYGLLQAWIPFYKFTQDSISGNNLPVYYRKKKTKDFSIQVAENLYLNKSYKDSIYKYIKESEQREKPGYKYSDLGYYILKEAIERKYKKRLDELANRYFYKALGADRTSFLPLRKFTKEEIIPTEKDTYYRDQLLHGHVHDMGAAMLGGVGGHAGLFSNANDVAKMMQMYLQKGFYGGRRFLKSSTIEKFNTRYFEKEKVRRGLGFDKPQLDPEIEATCGCVSDKSFGHSGFTGTYTWADPESGIVYVFLSNRVYPTMENIGLIENNIRTEIQKIIQESILEE